jgi:hypothetical protein
MTMWSSATVEGRMASVVQGRLVEVELVEAPVAQRVPVAEGKTF